MASVGTPQPKPQSKLLRALRAAAEPLPRADTEAPRHSRLSPETDGQSDAAAPSKTHERPVDPEVLEIIRESYVSPWQQKILDALDGCMTVDHDHVSGFDGGSVEDPSGSGRQAPLCPSPETFSSPPSHQQEVNVSASAPAATAACGVERAEQEGDNVAPHPSDRKAGRKRQLDSNKKAVDQGRGDLVDSITDPPPVEGTREKKARGDASNEPLEAHAAEKESMPSLQESREARTGEGIPEAAAPAAMAAAGDEGDVFANQCNYSGAVTGSELQQRDMQDPKAGAEEEEFLSCESEEEDWRHNVESIGGDLLSQDSDALHPESASETFKTFKDFFMEVTRKDSAHEAHAHGAAQGAERPEAETERKVPEREWDGAEEASVGEERACTPDRTAHVGAELESRDAEHRLQLARSGELCPGVPEDAGIAHARTVTRTTNQGRDILQSQSDEATVARPGIPSQEGPLLSHPPASSGSLEDQRLQIKKKNLRELPGRERVYDELLGAWISKRKPSATSQPAVAAASLACAVREQPDSGGVAGTAEHNGVGTNSSLERALKQDRDATQLEEKESGGEDDQREGGKGEKIATRRRKVKLEKHVACEVEHVMLRQKEKEEDTERTRRRETRERKKYKDHAQSKGMEENAEDVLKAGQKGRGRSQGKGEGQKEKEVSRNRARVSKRVRGEGMGLEMAGEGRVGSACPLRQGGLGSGDGSTMSGVRGRLQLASRRLDRSRLPPDRQHLPEEELDLLDLLIMKGCKL